MFSIQKCTVPANTLLYKYSINGSYVDCYSTEILKRVPLSEYIFEFYTTSLFKLERFILKLTVSKPSTDTQARQLSEGDIVTFAAWHVENRCESEILMCDLLGRTRSWLMVTPENTTDGDRTRLYFGSAVVPTRISNTGRPTVGFGFQGLLGFHKIYSRLLLYSAKSRIKSQLSREH